MRSTIVSLSLCLHRDPSLRIDPGQYGSVMNGRMMMSELPGGTERSRVTTADVAREAGVSRGTVSYALNGDPDSRLLEATKQKVLDAAERLGYRPSAAARLLGGGRSRTILFLSSTDDAINPLMTAYAEELARELATLGYGLLWQPAFVGLPRPANEMSPAVVITSPTENDPEFAELATGFRVPVVTALPGRDEFIASAATIQVEFLLGRGYEALYFARPDGTNDRMVELRLAAARRASSAPVHDVPWPGDRAKASRLAARLAGWARVPFAVCAYNDDVALQVLAAAADAGITVPDAFGVIGVDDTFAARYSTPALTSVSSSLAHFVPEFARHLAALAHGAIASEVRLPLNREVVVRSSTR
ncbi:LacI family DNA-binding transcriptional regulator [Microbacterium sp. STN6]|uniref:LacI family DNA-binding transcriptional regulator n=1 Tax=Microbacterium sp. STN6 TaxID=2995588 RepID=UPI002260FA5A|nr:LacI family DNA-binding transcriptional regulator [Microbacterium sp. STN6]MCX7522521.1 LacI family DNA-binding transcriptional regulator [Microbacterium sp. STN6]